ncbi:uncharacterized protein LOC131619203 [Vicia villosa]|uniref:uncharacterized protein LOC131619203 n=1 Tax=Vicia villosa TaxID=3911 RepID=UPI00273ADBFE|nr:uncharacterized protein LOC131619203 [Vicia villosa]
MSKLLASRLKRGIGKLISIKQPAFIKGRNILYVIFMVNEILDMAKREKRSCLVFKVDYEKAYDCVSWNYLRFLVIRMGFRSKWLDWMEACLFSSSMAVLVNSSYTEDFKCGKRFASRGPIVPFSVCHCDGRPN